MVNNMQQIIDNINTFNVLVPRLYNYEKIEILSLYAPELIIKQTYNNKDYEINITKLQSKLAYISFLNVLIYKKYNISDIDSYKRLVEGKEFSKDNNIFHIKRYNNVLNIISLTVTFMNNKYNTSPYTNIGETITKEIKQRLSSYIVLLEKTPYINQYRIKESDILFQSEKTIIHQTITDYIYNAYSYGAEGIHKTTIPTNYALNENNNLLEALEENEKICIKLSEKAKNIL